MPAVLLTVAETVTGSELADALAGGDTGLDLGQVVNGSYAPVTDQSLNTGRQEIVISHDATIDPITNLAFHVEAFSGTYGGADSAANDYTTLIGYGAADTGATNNNSDGLSRGLHIDQDWQVTSTTQFNYSREATGQKRIFGKDYSGKDGETLAKAFPAHVDAMSYWDGASELDATAPETGKVGRSSGTGAAAEGAALGNRCHFMKRFYLHQAATVGGIAMWDWVASFSYTA